MWPSLTTRVTGERLVVAGEVQPTALSDTYRVRIVYDYGEYPKSFVDQPALRPRHDGASIPHIYPGPRPCLFLPGADEWTGREMLAETIIPWLLLWLTYYELWHATGEWQGGGEHPNPVDASAGLRQEDNYAAGTSAAALKGAKGDA